LIALHGDYSWPTTLILFGPRWVWALPLAGLVPLAARVRPAALAPLILASALVVGPLMGYRIPWPSRWEPGPARLAVRVLSFNVQQGNVSPDALRYLIASTEPDIVLLQECPEEVYVTGLFDAQEWRVRFDHGMGLASRYGIGQVEELPPRQPWSDGVVRRYELTTPIGPLQLFGVHLETPREGIEAMLSRPWAGAAEMRGNIALRHRESAIAGRWVEQFPGPVLVAGDFNLPVESRIFQDCWSGFADCFSEAGRGFGYTKFTRWFGVRIDHILASPGWSCRRCMVEPDIGSDHRPLVADLVWIGGSG
jgi:endonuclease/exonuclease/phosphatase (EEP) superfamily protein YafD